RLIRRGRESGNLFVDFVVPGDVRHQVHDQRERPHQPHVNFEIDELVDAGLAHKTRSPVDLCAAGAALGGFAVPAAGEVVREVRLEVVDRVEQHHALDGGHLQALLLAAPGFATEDLQHDRAV